MAALVFATVVAGAASAQVSGTVTDAATGEPLVGAAVRVAGTTVGAAADLDGRYRIPNAPTGAVTLVASYLGYEPDSVAVVVPDGGLTQDFALRLASIQGEGVTVTAQAEGQLAAINQQLRDNRVVNVVSADRIQELPDANAAEAIGRLPGVAVTRSGGEANRVALRGLGPSFTNVTVNGQQLPATGSDRSTDINSVTPELLAGVEVYKTVTPDQDADAIGGSVNFRLRDAPERRRISVRAQGGYNGLRSDVGNYKGTASFSDRFVGDRLGAVFQLALERANRGSDVLGASYDVPDGTANDTLYAEQLNLFLREETRGRLGATALLDYRVPGGTVRFSAFASRLDRDQASRQMRYGLSNPRIDYDVEHGGEQTDLFSTALSGEHALGPAEIDWTASRAVTRREDPGTLEFRFSQNRNAYSRSPVETFTDLAGVVAAATPDVQSTFIDRSSFASGLARESDLVASGNLRLPYALGEGWGGFVKVGGKVRQKDRESDVENEFLLLTSNDGRVALTERFPERTFERVGGTTFGQVSLSNWLDGREEASIFGGAFGIGPSISVADLDEVRRRLADVYLPDFIENLDDYEASERVAAAYAMGELNVGPVTVIPGVRFEHTRVSYTARNGVLQNQFEQTGIVEDMTSLRTYADWFPALLVRYRPTDWLDLRVARTEGIARPSHFQANPRLRRNDTQAILNRGNPSLRAARSANYDALVSVYSNAVGLFTVGGFLKDIDDVVYQRQSYVVLDAEAEGLPEEVLGYSLFDYANLPDVTRVRGVEVEWQTQLPFLRGALSGFVLTTNYSYTWSNTRYPRTELRTIPIENPPPSGPFRRLENADVSVEGPMPTQADHLANVSLGYDRAGFSARVSAQYQGVVLKSVGGTALDDRYTASFARWDVRVLQRLNAQASVFLNLNNVTSTHDIEYQGPVRRLAGDQAYGWTADLGVRFEL